MSKARKGIRVALDTLGCKLNQAETELMARQFMEAGYDVVSPPEPSDVYILNTCTVTHMADQKSRQRLRLARRRSGAATLVATGCYAQRAPDALKGIEGVDLVVGNEHKAQLPGLLEGLQCITSLGNITGGVISSGEGLRTRALVKIQDGCNSSCAYCIVPLVRPREESVPVEQVVAEINDRLSGGCREAVLTGVEIGRYSYNGLDLKGLLQRILAETGITRLRLSSLQPDEISSGFMELWQNSRLCRHFHLSLQSGSDGVLSRMRRRYSVGDYQQAVSLVRSLLPEAAITTDIIVGFPGETDEEFEESYEFCRQMEFARIHVFAFSPRPGTLAAQMPQMVTARVKKERSRRMLALAKESGQSFPRRFLGQTREVLWEKQTAGVWSGLTDNYIRVYTRNGEDLTNQIVATRLAEVSGDGVWGEIELP
ncbi:tRNA (N(6)-L-threonylcarbamoyladenosine(37)-C(2))-methylthiotransferase MtaB [Chloroflexota bacterium]